MFESLVETLKKLIPKSHAPDPARFDDPVARITEWTPTKGGGTNFRTHKFVLIDTQRAEFKATLGARLFGGVFIAMGLFAACAFLIGGMATTGKRFEITLLIPIIFGLVFVAVGMLLLASTLKPIVFDKRSGYFWKGRRDPSQQFDAARLKNALPLAEIHALQIIREYVRGNKSSYFSFELNIVRKDGTRMNVVDHGNLDKLRGDARELAAFLNVPIWDAA